MTRENKLALLIGFSVILLVGMLVGDHFSKARHARVDPAFAGGPEGTGANSPVSVEPLGSPADGRSTPAGPTIIPAGLNASPVSDSIVRGPSIPPVDILNGAIPGASTDQTSIADTTVPPGPDASRPPAAPTRPYTVKSGDALEKIAQKELGDRAMWRAIADLNAELLKGGHDIRAGMVIALPDPAATRTSTATAANRSPRDAGSAPGRTDPAASPRTHLIRSGDTLKKIARQYFGNDARSDEIARLNRLRDPNRLIVGETLKLPAR